MPKKPSDSPVESETLAEQPLQAFPFPGLGTVIHARTQEEALAIAEKLQADIASQSLPS